ncbi:MAG: S26 family signal peptidase [Candidatus Helarchaeota archaeon]|nr:S26 family signal peptidase [Candidatus Helarchaeota archaeon]
MDTLRRQFPAFKNINTLVYLGKSMYPTLVDLDIIQFSPYQNTPIRRGDVIVFKRQDGPDCIIIHRVIAISPDGSIRTQGDNCRTTDSWTLRPSEVLGVVTSAQRGDRFIRILRGNIGYQIFLIRRIIAETVITSKNIAKHPNQWISAIMLPSRIISQFLTYKVVTFSGSNRSETLLFLGPVCIGWLPIDKGVWEIKPLYRIFIDPHQLLSSGGTPQSDTRVINETISIQK